MDIYKNVKVRRDQLEAKVRAEEKKAPPRLFINHFERRILDWHIASLEYANSAPIKHLSMKHWDQDDAFEFPGDHYIVANGYDTIYENLATKAKDMGVEFRLGQEVKSIQLESDTVKLSILDLTSDNQPGMKSKDKSNASVPYDLSFGSVVVTAPLGVLKA